MPHPFPLAHWQSGGASSLLTGLAAYYKLDEASGNRLDSVGANHLVPTGSPGNGIGKVSNAIVFDGTAKYAECADASAFDVTTLLSISVWVYPTSFVNNQTMASKWTYATDGEWVLDTSGGGVGNNTKVQMYIAGSATDPVTNFGTSPAVLSATTWHHLVWLFDGTQTGNANRLKLYVNGSAQTLTFTGTIPATLRNGTAPLRVGAWSGSLTRYFNGRIDELGLWNRVLNTTEIAALYNAGSGVAYPF